MILVWYLNIAQIFIATSITQNIVKSASSFLNIINITQIELSHKQLCDDSISLEEIINAIKGFKNNRSPGVDGLTAEFFKEFDEQLAPFLLEVFVESIEKGTLPPLWHKDLLVYSQTSKRLFTNWQLEANMSSQQWLQDFCANICKKN